MADVRPSILDVISDNQVWKTSELKLAVMDRVQLSDSQRAQALKTGQGRADNRVGWALSFLTRAKAVEKVSKGHSRITDFGHQMLAEHPVEITEADLEAVPAFQAYIPKKHAPASIAIDTEHLPSYWLVGAFFNGEEGWDGPIGDQTDRFIAEGRGSTGTRANTSTW